jgi:hypothetical protein
LLFLLLVVTRLGLFHQWLPDTDMWLVAALGTLCYVLCSGWAARARIRRLVLRG